MSIETAQWIVLLVGVYVGFGLLVAPWLIFFGAKRFDRAAADSTRGFRVIVLPGAILLWPFLLRRALAGRGVPPGEAGAHRLKATARIEHPS